MWIVSSTILGVLEEVTEIVFFNLLLHLLLQDIEAAISLHDILKSFLLQVNSSKKCPAS